MQDGAAGAGARTVLLYFGGLTLLVALADPLSPLMDFASTFMLKDRLRASAPDVSMFRLLTAVPTYLAVAFGFARDLWNPLGRRDRGFFLLFAPLTAAAFAALAFLPLSYAGLFVGMILVMLSFRFIVAAQQGLLALIGQERLMSGRLSALLNLVAFVPFVAGSFAGGWAAERLTPSGVFLLMAGLSAAIFALGLLRPRAVFEQAYDRPEARGSTLVGDIRRLLKHRAIWPPLVIMCMGQFMPGFNTPLQFYLTNHLHAPDSAYGEFQGVFFAAFIPVFALYGWLCRRFSLKALLWVGWTICIPQMVPLAFIRSASDALMLAVPLGAMGGVAVASLGDLTIRSCPPGLQGALMMMVLGINVLATRGSDLVGARIFAADPAHGFLNCVLATVVVYALILPVLLFIPRELIATADGEPSAVVEAERLAEIAAA